MGAYARTATRLGIDIVSMIWDSDVNNIARMAQANLSVWDELNTQAKAEAERKNRR